MKKDTDRDSHTLDMITREVGLLEMQDGHVTPEDMRWAESVAASIQVRAAEYRRNRLPKTVPPIKKAEPITARLRAMPRALLETLFGSLVEKWGPEAQFAHRHLDTLSDNDLRRMIQTMENRSTKE
ncbi:MAG: hypothetical protein NT062_38720 [Proteobacteria bacterium]|nr:hypothetical protein [Pseudomonadota bacterium]